MSKPLLSVVVPAHNAENRLEKCLLSITNQSYTNYELIIICDACEDRTAQIARTFTDLVFETDFHRDGLARNVGIDHASGEWIVFIDDDDWLLHEYCFQIIADNIGRNDEEIFFFDLIWKGKGYVSQTAQHFERMTAGHCIRNTFIGDIRFDDKPYSADIVFFNKLLRKAPVAAFLPSPIYYYNYLREGSLSDLHRKGLIKP